MLAEMTELTKLTKLTHTTISYGPNYNQIDNIDKITGKIRRKTGGGTIDLRP